MVLVFGNGLLKTPKGVLSKDQWDTEQERVILIDPEDNEDSLDLESNHEYMKTICGIMNVDEGNGGNGFEFDIKFVVDEVSRPKKKMGITTA
jgi:hypothetical protein